MKRVEIHYQPDPKGSYHVVIYDLKDPDKQKVIPFMTYEGAEAYANLVILLSKDKN